MKMQLCLKTKNGQLLFCKFFRIIQFFFLILLRDVTLESKVTPTNRKSAAFLLHTSKCFSNVELFSISTQTFLETMLFCLPAVKKIINKNACLNIVLATDICNSILPQSFCQNGAAEIFFHISFHRNC